MRKRKFKVPGNLFFEFIYVMLDNDLKGTILEIAEGNQIVISIPYDSDEHDAIDALHEMIQDYNEENEED